MSKNALLSVYDKTGIVEFAGALVDLGWTIYASGGTAKVLAEEHVTVTDVAELVGGEAILGHRVVTLSRELHAGLLARYEADEEEMRRLDLPYIDLVCVDLYPLADEIAKEDATHQSVIEKTDIGGPTMLNSAAKGERIVIADSADRKRVIEWLKDGEPDRTRFIAELGAKVQFVVSSYYIDAARYHSGGYYDGTPGSLVYRTKYGENPYASPAGLYTTGTNDPLALDQFQVVAGDNASFVNLTDLDSALQVLTHIGAGFRQNADTTPKIAVGVKHGNPCGVAAGDDAVEVAGKMVAGDPRAIFGGVLLFNYEVTREVAEALTAGQARYDGVIAPSFGDGAAELLERKTGKCRLIVNPALATHSDVLDTSTRYRPVRGGFLIQPNYTFVLDVDASRVEGPNPSHGQKLDVCLAWAIGSVSVSNTITIVRDGQLLANGVGQQDRVGAAELAIKRARDAEHDLTGAVAWSDSFFPFPDGIQVLVDAGVTTIFASSGSIGDQKVIQVATDAGVTLLMQPDKEVRGFARH